MCIAIVTRPGASVGNADLYRGWTGNRDGGGFAYVDDGQVVIKKGFMVFNDFQKAYRNAVELFGMDSPFLIHMRIGTSGGVTPANTHPFAIKDGAMIHNGIMFHPTGERAGTGKDLKSDTRVFAEALHNILVLDHIKKAEKGIKSAIGYGNKLAFLYNTKEYHIIGEDSGFWADGVWYSNTSCVARPDYRNRDNRV